MKHNYFQDEKLEYEEIEVPDELLFMVRRTIAADRKKKAAAKRSRMLRAAASMAAVLLLCLAIGVNSSYAFAEAAVKIPVVKGVAQAVVVRSYRPEIMAVYEEHRAGGQTGKAPEETADKQPENVPADKQDTLPAVEEAAIQQPDAETAGGLEAWKAEMTPERLREVTELYATALEQKYADTPEKLRTILLAELPERDISLYGYHEGGAVTGTVLRVGDTQQCFDWKYMNESGKLPEISCKDRDGDGTEEILVFLYNGEDRHKEPEKEAAAAADGKAEEELSAGKNAKTAGEENAPQNVELKEETAGKEEIPEPEGQETNPAEKKEETEKETPAVSDNDAEKPAEESSEEIQSAGECWVISIKGGNWTVSAETLPANSFLPQSSL